MSDGNDATPDHRGTPGTGTGRHTRPSPQPALTAAPWERFAEPPPDHNAYRWQAEPAHVEPVAPEARAARPARAAAEDGCHAGGGLTVADLIAKLAAPVPDRPGHHHVAPDPEPPEAAPDSPIDLESTQVIDIPAYLPGIVSELTD